MPKTIINATLQLSVTDMPSPLPVTEDGVREFLASHWVDGIGETFARKLTEKFSTDAVNVLSETPSEAGVISGLGEARAVKASENIRSIKYDLNLLLFLFSCGLGDIFIQRILSKYGKRAEDIIRKDPYSLVENVWQFSFFSADKIGQRLGITKEDPLRLRGALVTAVKRGAEEGHLYLTPEKAAESAAHISGTDPTLTAAEISDCVAEGRLIESRGGLYLPVFYNAEKDGASRIRRLASFQREPTDPGTLPTISRQGQTYSPQQREAILTVLDNSVSTITGGPGSGKTTVVKGIIDILRERGEKVVLAAPTGRAAKRLSTLTGAKASTIHSLLGYRPGEGYRHHKIDADTIIIDEGSMMEQVLFGHILQGVKDGTRIVIVGDADQLPAIGAGDVLRDMLKSDTVAVARLDENFRQPEGSLIASGARDINAGQTPVSDTTGDFMFVPERGQANIHDRILSVIADEIPATRDISPTDILVVTPQQIGKLGARQLNQDLQERLNPEGPSLKRGATTMRLGDPVMQTANSRERGVYNGEVGHITSVNTDQQTLTVTFADGHTSEYLRSELGELTLAYATTVHKLQGSEAKNIVIPVTMAHKPMLYRNLLYTAVSRATDLCILVGEKEALEYAVANTPATARNSNFALRLDDPPS